MAVPAVVRRLHRLKWYLAGLIYTQANSLTNDREISSRGSKKLAPSCHHTRCFSCPFRLDSMWLGIAGVVGQPLRRLNSVTGLYGTRRWPLG